MSKTLDLGPITAYAIAVKNGFVGTEQEWLESLKCSSVTDEQVSSAVDAYLESHPDATVPDGSVSEDKLAQDVKDKFDALSEEIANIGGGAGTGAPGKSAYQYAVEGGYTGTEAEFSAKLAKEKFANPNALTFTGAVTGSYDGSALLEVEIPGGGGESGDYIPNPSTASVGQTIVVKSTDENGKPTEWEAVDMASGGGSISLPLLYDMTTSEEVGWIDTGDNAFLAKSLLSVELISIATTTNESDGSGSASIYPLKPGFAQAPWNNQAVAVKTSALMAKTYTKVFRAFCFRGDDGHWTSITSIRNMVNDASVTPGMVSSRTDGVTDQPMRGLIIGNAAASSSNVFGVGSRLRVWGV